MTFQTFAFVAFKLFAAIVVAKQPAIDEKTIFAAALYDETTWTESRIAINRKGTIEVWKPSNDKEWEEITLAFYDFAHYHSPTEISSDAKWIGFHDFTHVKIASITTPQATPSEQEIWFPTKPHSISLNKDATVVTMSTVVWADLWDPILHLFRKDNFGNYGEDTAPDWIKLNPVVKHFAKVNPDGNAFAMTQFGPHEARTDVFYWENSTWLQWCSSIPYHYTWDSAKLKLDDGQSVLSMSGDGKRLAVSYPDQTIVYQANGEHDSDCIWEEFASIPGGYSNAMTSDGSKILIGYNNDNTALFDIDYKKVTKSFEIDAKNSWILSISDDAKHAVVNGDNGGIYPLTSLKPTVSLTLSPTLNPTASPTGSPTGAPSPSPSAASSDSPTVAPNLKASSTSTDASAIAGFIIISVFIIGVMMARNGF